MGTSGYVGRDFIKNNHGYSYLYVWAPDHPNRTKSGHVAAHRLVASNTIGRPLQTGEVVHHENGNTLDNSPENLRVLPLGEHTKIHKPRHRVTKRCAHCDAVIERKWSDTTRRNPKAFYCSQRCRGAGRVTRVDVICDECGATFAVVPAKVARGARFCGHRCHMLNRHRMHQAHAST